MRKEATKTASSCGFLHDDTEAKLTVVPSNFLPLHSLKTQLAIHAAAHEHTLTCTNTSIHQKSPWEACQFQGAATPIEAEIRP